MFENCRPHEKLLLVLRPPARSNLLLFLVTFGPCAQPRAYGADAGVLWRDPALNPRRAVRLFGVAGSIRMDLRAGADQASRINPVAISLYTGVYRHPARSVR